AFLKNPQNGLFGGLGGFFEYERWNYNGVKAELLPLDQSPIEVNSWKANAYLNYKKWFAEKFFLDVGLYYQTRFDRLWSRYRIAISTEFSWQMTEHVQLLVRYQPLYDKAPIVPIRQWFHQFTTTFSLNF
ncbi:MAG: hypothetical protein AAGJ18_08650, partial [Bacteroidota bacterium]